MRPLTLVFSLALWTVTLLGLAACNGPDRDNGQMMTDSIYVDLITAPSELARFCDDDVLELRVFAERVGDTLATTTAMSAGKQYLGPCRCDPPDTCSVAYSGPSGSFRLGLARLDSVTGEWQTVDYHGTDVSTNPDSAETLNLEGGDSLNVRYDSM